MGILVLKGGISVGMKGLALTLGLGAAAGAVAILMMPKNNPTRELATKAAMRVEDAAQQLGSKISREMDL